MSQEFSKLKIDFSQDNKASVYFAHLQNILNQAIQKPTEFVLNKLDKTLCDIFKEHQMLYLQHLEMSLSFKSTLEQFGKMMEQCKNNRQMLAKVTQDRYDLMQKMKQNVEDSLEYVEQNENLHKAMKKMKELNDLIIEKNQVLENQLRNQIITEGTFANLSILRDQYNRISSDNSMLTKQFTSIQNQVNAFAKISSPLQVLSLLFKQKPTIREQIWTTVMKDHKDKFHDIDKTKKQFFEFDIDDVLKQFKS